VARQQPPWQSQFAAKGSARNDTNAGHLVHGACQRHHRSSNLVIVRDPRGVVRACLLKLLPLVNRIGPANASISSTPTRCGDGGAQTNGVRLYPDRQARGSPVLLDDIGIDYVEGRLPLCAQSRFDNRAVSHSSAAWIRTFTAFGMTRGRPRPLEPRKIRVWRRCSTPPRPTPSVSWRKSWDYHVRVRARDHA